MEDETKRSRAKKKLLRVTFPNGKAFCYNNAAATMVAVLSEIGSEQFPLIKMEVCHLPMLSKEVYPQYQKYMKPVWDGWYVNTQPNTDSKYMQLKSINSQLNLDLKIEMGDDFETEVSPNRESRSKSKDKLSVKFPDGEIVTNDSVNETFLECIGKLGVDDIKRKELSWGGNALISLSHTLRNQIQVDSDRWIIVPNTTKDKVKLLRVISAMLHIKLEINII